MQIQSLVKENYKKFCYLEGNNYIASEFALLQILRIIKKFQIRSILEIGLGIGSISDTVLKMQRNGDCTLRYVGTEANEYCKSVLKNNVEDYNCIEVHENLANLKSGGKFDLIIIDGQDATLSQIASFCSERAIIFIEGDRSPQTELMFSLFPQGKYVHVISLKKNKIYSPGNPAFFVGGGRIIFTNPSFMMKLFWLKEKIGTLGKRQIRKIK